MHCRDVPYASAVILMTKCKLITEVDHLKRYSDVLQQHLFSFFDIYVFNLHAFSFTILIVSPLKFYFFLIPAFDQ